MERNITGEGLYDKSVINILKTIITTDLNHRFTNQVFIFIILQEEKHKNSTNLIRL